jgi:HTH-type transcriptional regulator/antitoxin HigA
MTTATNATWVKHPGYYIKEEMDAREWLQRDLAFILGVPEQAVNMILSGKRSISPDMALALADAFDTDRDFFANLQKAFDLAHARTPDPSVAVRGSMQSRYPVREMIKRGWIEPSDTTLLETQLVRFFEVNKAKEIPYLAHAAKKSRYEEREIPPGQLVWLFRVRQIARAVAVPAYSEQALRKAVKQLERLLIAPEEARHVPQILAACGIRFVLVEKLPGAKIDGVCFWLDDTSPVIGMTTKRDTIDNFWFVLRHEIEHVLRQDGKTEEVIDVLEGEGASATSTAIPEQERIANAAAADFCAPADKLDLFMIRKRPFYYEKDVIAFARMHHRHPGLVVGQMQKRMDRWNYLTKHLVKIRQCVIPAAITDGWGQVIPVSL